MEGFLSIKTYFLSILNLKNDEILDLSKFIVYKQNAHLTVKSVYLVSRARKFNNLKLHCHLLPGISQKYCLIALANCSELVVYFLMSVVS